jgi:hypothetical protein
MSTRLHSPDSSASKIEVTSTPAKRFHQMGGYRLARRRVVRRFDSGVQRVTGSAARRFTRREFIRRAGDVALVSGVSLSGVIWQARRASAADPVNDCGPTSGGCDNNYICTQSQLCTSDPNGGRNCNTSGCNCGGVRRRVNCTTSQWSGVSSSCCGNTSSQNCWRENCPSGCKRCCDCCVPPSFGYSSTCNSSSCGGNDKRKCICRSNVNTC